MKLKKGDKVVVIAGKDRGTTGTISRTFPKKDLVLIDGVNVVKRHRKATSQSQQGQIIDKPMPIHVSNIMTLDPKNGKRTRITIVRDAKGLRSRKATKSKLELTA